MRALQTWSWFRLCQISIALTVLGTVAASASTLTWSSYTWSAGSPTAGATVYQGFNIDNTYPSGNEITVSVKNNNSNMSWQSGYPQISNNPNTGGVSGSALQLYAASNNRSGLTTTIFFNYSTGVRNVSFTLWDVDASGTQFKDRISGIYAVTVTGQIVAATTITGSADNTVAGTGTNSTVTGTANAGNNTSAGNVNISFNTTEDIRSISFTWSNLTYSGAQSIGLSNITYTIAPEFGVGEAALLICLLAIIAGEVKRHRRARRPQSRQPELVRT